MPYLVSDAPRIMRLPWELLRDGEDCLARRIRFTRGTNFLHFRTDRASGRGRGFRLCFQVLGPVEGARGIAEELRAAEQMIHFRKPVKKQLLIGVDPGLGLLTAQPAAFPHATKLGLATAPQDDQPVEHPVAPRFHQQRGIDDGPLQVMTKLGQREGA